MQIKNNNEVKHLALQNIQQMHASDKIIIKMKL